MVHCQISIEFLCWLCTMGKLSSGRELRQKIMIRQVMTAYTFSGFRTNILYGCCPTMGPKQFWSWILNSYNNSTIPRLSKQLSKNSFKKAKNSSKQLSQTIFKKTSKNLFKNRVTRWKKDLYNKSAHFLLQKFCFYIKSRGPILHVTWSQSCSVCVVLTNQGRVFKFCRSHTTRFL